MDHLIKERNEKILFLEKRIIQQDNSIFTLQTTNKKLQAEKEGLKAKAEEGKSQKEELEVRYAMKLEEQKVAEQKYVITV
jgi:hypothetical protein